MRHKLFLIKGHWYQIVVTNKYFDNKDKPQLAKLA
jgi:hypothetical protein